MHILTTLPSDFFGEMKCRDLIEAPAYHSIINTAYYDNVKVENVTGYQVDGIPHIYQFEKMGNPPTLLPLDDKDKVAEMLAGGINAIINFVKNSERYSKFVTSFDPIAEKSYVDLFTKAASLYLAKWGYDYEPYRNDYSGQEYRLCDLYNGLAPFIFTQLEGVPDAPCMTDHIIFRTQLTAFMTLCYYREGPVNLNNDWRDFPVFSIEDDGTYHEEGTILLDGTSATAKLRAVPFN